MKKIIIFLTAVLLLLSSCAKSPISDNAEKNAEEEIEVNEHIDNDAPQETAETKEVGKEAEKMADSGVKLTVDATGDPEAGALMQTETFYYFGGEKLLCVKNINTYATPEDAQDAYSKYKDLEESCVDVSVNGEKVTFYASEGALSLSEDMTKADVEMLGQNIKAEVERF